MNETVTVRRDQLQQILAHVEAALAEVQELKEQIKT